MPTVDSVHIPTAMNNLSIRGWGKKWKSLSMDDINEFAKTKGITFKQAYTELVSNLYNKEN